MVRTASIGRSCVKLSYVDCELGAFKYCQNRSVSRTSRTRLRILAKEACTCAQSVAIRVCVLQDEWAFQRAERLYSRATEYPQPLQKARLPY